ncbi:Serine incorporator (Serinc) [Fragilaria crotonensis]|nr:Serine incorporator (Serinc) [Fragilaria crotonensis]
MASFISCIATSLVWCCGTATWSLASSCCGNDKSSSEPPSASSGRKRSVLLLILTIVIALVFQYGVAPRVLDVPVSNYVTTSWTDACLQYRLPAGEAGDNQDDLVARCMGNNGVYRATGSAFLFFLLAGLAAFCKPTANREAWPAKYVLFLFLVFGTCFIPSTPLFSPIFLNIARVGGVIFVLIQQIIILDLAYNWNESWVEKSNKAETETDTKRWLAAILASCVLLFTITLVGIVLLFWKFTGCSTNNAFISLTLIFSIVVTALQLFASDEGSLLSSAVICTYGTYLCYTAVSKNPDGVCNPQLGQDDVLGIVFGIGLSILSLGWTGYSYTAEDTINSGSSNDLGETLVDEEKPAPTASDADDPNNKRKVQGIVTNAEDIHDTEEPSLPAAAASSSSKPQRPVSWKLNIILAMISCWIAMALTGWGSIEAGGDAANPDVSRVSMWMLIASQWIVYLLYFWSLMAPKFFPDRDFS